MRLLRVELWRAWTRRFIRVLLALAILNVAIASLLVFIRHDSVGTIERKQAEAVAQESACLRGEILRPGDPLTVEELRGPWGEVVPETVFEGFREQFCGDYRAVLESRIREFPIERIPDVAESLIGILLLMALIIGASLIGAEWAADTVVTHLTWEPRRMRTYLTKALAAILVVTVLFIVVEVLTIGGLALSALLRSTTEAPPEMWNDLAGTVGRGAIAAGMTAGFGFAIAATTRSTVFSLAFTFLIFLTDTLLLRAVQPELARWSLFLNLSGYMGARGVDPVVTETVIIPGRSPGGSGILVAIYIGVMLVAGATLFRRRDVI